MKRNIIIFFIVYICSGCSYYSLYFDRNYYRVVTEEGVSGIRPISPRFRLAKPQPYHLKLEDQIDTNAIYVRKNMFDKIVFLRFFHKWSNKFRLFKRG